ncbi:2-phospho-L-lactate guanylyltransferase [Anaerolineales bacterium]
MSLWVIIPVKPLNLAKTRLADVLTPSQRYEFAQSMLLQILSVVTSVPHLAGTLVISRDTKALSLARDFGAKTIQETGNSSLNEALTRATQVVRMWGGEAVIIIPADLPFITAYDLQEIIAIGSRITGIVVGTDLEGTGTNIMMMRPPGLIPYYYGANSFNLHIQAANELAVQHRIYEADNLLLDIDVPEDLMQYNRRVLSGSYTYLPTFLPNQIN